MMKQLNFLLLLILISVFSQSCRKDIDNIEITPPNLPTVVKVISSMHGTVVDENGNAVSNASVTFEDEIVQTDENGVFQFIDKKLNKNGTFVSVEKDGYFKGSRRLYPSAGNTSIINIELIPMKIKTFDSNEETSIIHDDVVLNFPKDAIVKEDGTAYNGQVDIAVAYLDPSNPTTLDQMPGDLTGISSDDGLVALTSLGMITVELMDENGNELQVKVGKLVDVEIPIPVDLQAAAPSTIPMWHFDEDAGIWMEEGFATLVGDHYETSLAHFSFWNCDVPNDFILLKGSVINRGVPIQGLTVMVLDPNSLTSGYATTDENGMFCGFVPNDAELTLIIYNFCGDEVYTTTITTTDQDIILDPINLNLLIDYANISGTVTYCDDALSEYAYIVVQTANGGFTFPILEDDTFSGTIFYCEEGEEIIISAFDPLNGLTSGDYIFEIEGDIEVGNIELCEGEFVEHIILEFGETSFNLMFDEHVTNIFYHAQSVITQGDEGYILKSVYQPEQGEDHLFKFYLPYVEGSPFQESRAEYYPPTGTGNGASGICTTQLVVQDGDLYFLANGTISGSDIIPTLNNEPMYFDIVIKI